MRTRSTRLANVTQVSSQPVWAEAGRGSGSDRTMSPRPALPEGPKVARRRNECDFPRSAPSTDRPIPEFKAEAEERPTSSVSDPDGRVAIDQRLVRERNNM